MAKSLILKQLANNSINLQVALSRLLIIASDINDENLMKWAENELNGYNEDDVMPNYRIVGAGPIFYSGINGSYKVTNLSFSISDLSPELREVYLNNYFMQSIATIEELSINSGKNKVYKDLTFYAGEFYKKSGIQCTSIKMVFPSSTFLEMMGMIRTKLIKIFIALDKEFGCLDELDVDIQGKDLKDIRDAIYYTIYQDNSVKIGDKNRIEGSLFNAERK
jgi:hypothetical protein